MAKKKKLCFEKKKNPDSMKKKFITFALILVLTHTFFCTQATGEAEEYTGEKIVFDFYKTDLKNVFKLLNEISKKNFAIDNDVAGEVTLCFKKPVPWDQAFDLILKMNKLEKVEQGNIIRIARSETLRAEEDSYGKMLKKKRAAEKSKNHKTEFITLNYSDAESVLPHVEKILTKDETLSEDEKGKASIDARTNSIILTDTPDVIKRAKEIVENLDKVTPQVMIEAKIVEASTSFANQIGILWEMDGGIQPAANLASGNTNVATLPHVKSSLNDRVGTETSLIGGTLGYNLAMNFPVSASNYGSIGINFARISGSPLILNAMLKAMESEGEGKIVSAPKILTLDNQKAKIQQGVEYPYIERDSSGGSSVRFKDINLVLEVTPHITPDDRISMEIMILKNDIGEKIEDEYSFTTKQAETTLLVNNNDTVKIGGIKKVTKNFSNIGLPGLAKIPILGWLFKSESRTDRQEELIIFITPSIVRL